MARRLKKVSLGYYLRATNPNRGYGLARDLKANPRRRVPSPAQRAELQSEYDRRRGRRYT